MILKFREMFEIASATLNNPDGCYYLWPELKMYLQCLA